MSVLIRLDETGGVTGVHYAPETLDNPKGLLVDSLIQPETLAGRDYRLTVVDQTPLWQSRTSAEKDENGNVVTPAGPWEDETATFDVQVTAMRATAQRQADTKYERLLSDIRLNYPELEREGWSEQINDARTYRARLDAVGGDASLVNISDLDVLTRLVAEGETTQELADRILVSRQQYRRDYGDATGWLRRVRNALAAAATGDEIEQVLNAGEI